MRWPHRVDEGALVVVVTTAAVLVAVLIDSPRRVSDSGVIGSLVPFTDCVAEQRHPDLGGKGDLPRLVAFHVNAERPAGAVCVPMRQIDASAPGGDVVSGARR